MRRSFKFRLYPSRQQQQLLTHVLQGCQQLYNAALEQRYDAWRSCKQSVSCFEQIKQLPDLRELPEFIVIYAQVLQDVVNRVDKAYRSFFRRLKIRGTKAGFPRFKAVDRYNSFTYPQAYNRGIRFTENKVRLSNVGFIRIKRHREVKGQIKVATVKREGKHWYIIFSCDHVPAKPLPHSDKEVGIDLGLSKFATLSDGSVIENPRHLSKSLVKLRAVQGRFSKKERGTSTRRKTKERVQAVYRKVRNQRRDFLHKTSQRLVDEYGFIVVEDLSIQKMLKLETGCKEQSRCLHRSIGDAGWATFLQFLAYKAEEAGRGIVKVPAQGTTRTCSNCGFVADKLPLSQRQFVCPACGFSLDRDYNASLNILRLGWSLVV